MTTRFALAAVSMLLVGTAACDLFPVEPVEPVVPVEDPACGAAPGAFDPTGDVVYAVSSEGCARIERRANGDGTFTPVRLIVHVDGFSRRIDVDTDALTYEGGADGTALVTTSDGSEVTAQIAFDVCTGEWFVDIEEGEASLAL